MTEEQLSEGMREFAAVENARMRQKESYGNARYCRAPVGDDLAFLILKAIARSGVSGVVVSDVADTVRCSRDATGKYVRQLVQQGVVRRMRDPGKGGSTYRYWLASEASQ